MAAQLTDEQRTNPVCSVCGRSAKEGSSSSDYPDFWAVEDSGVYIVYCHEHAHERWIN